MATETATPHTGMQFDKDSKLNALLKNVCEGYIIHTEDPGIPDLTTTRILETGNPHDESLDWEIHWTQVRALPSWFSAVVGKDIRGVEKVCGIPFRQKSPIKAKDNKRKSIDSHAILLLRLFGMPRHARSTFILISTVIFSRSGVRLKKNLC